MELVEKKQSKGITLIALVITIIVLLILSGVTLSLLLGENGILKKSVESKITHDKEKAIEGLKLVQNEYMVENKSGKLNASDDNAIEDWLNIRKNKNQIDNWNYAEEQNIINKGSNNTPVTSLTAQCSNQE